MPSLILNGETLRVTLHSKRLEILKRVHDAQGERQESYEVPLHDIDHVVIMGQPAVTMPVLTRLMDEGIPAFFVTRHGRWRGSLSPDNNLNAQRRIMQYEAGTDPVFALHVARKLIYAKIRNSRRVLQRLAANRELLNDPRHQTASSEMKSLAEQVLSASDLDLVRGLEGLAAAHYFRQLTLYFPAELAFKGRNRRPPRDPANALLSFAYTVLLSEMEGAIRTHGLDAGIGALHANRINTPSLALDLMEPLRAAIADLMVLNLANHKMVKAETDFEYTPEDGGVYLNENGRKFFFIMYEQTMTRRFAAVKGEAHTDLRRVIDQQVCIYLRMLEHQEYEHDFFFLP